MNPDTRRSFLTISTRAAWLLLAVTGAEALGGMGWFTFLVAAGGWAVLWAEDN